MYPSVFIDAIWLKIRDCEVVANRACHVTVGVDLEGRKQVLGLWLGVTQGEKIWANVLTEIRNRGVRDILVLCCDGLTGLPTAVNSIHPETVVQTCVFHLLRSAMEYASYSERKTMGKDMRPIYTAATVPWPWRTSPRPGRRRRQGRCWPCATPGMTSLVPGLHPEIRKVFYTTNQIESINYQLRKITKTRSSFPSGEATMKLAHLDIRNIDLSRGGELGTDTQGWHRARNAFAVHTLTRPGDDGGSEATERTSLHACTT